MTECCMTAKKPRKGAIHFLKDIFRDTTQRKENAFYTLLPEGKNNSGRDVMIDAPAKIDEMQLEELSIKIDLHSADEPK